MDGTYGNVFPTSRSMSPALGNPSSANERYKINVSRQKTRKWANFKPQNYDGDDWGDDCEDEPEPPPPPKPQGPRSPATASSPSEVQQHQRAVTMPVAHQHPIGAQENADSLGSLGSLGSLPSQAQPRKNSMDASRPSGLPWLSRAAGLPDASSSTKSVPSPSSPNRPFVRPADIYRKLEEERRRSLEYPPNQVTKPVGNAQKPAERLPENPVPTLQGSELGIGDGSVANQGGPTTRPLLPTVAERKSEHGIEGLLDSYGSDEHNVGPSSGPPQLSYAETTTGIQAPKPVGGSAQPSSQGEGLRRFSTSPQLPLVTRMSGFGEDLFSPSSFFDQVKPRSPITESTSVSTPTSAMAVSAQVQDPSPVSVFPPLSTSTLRTSEPTQPPTESARTGEPAKFVSPSGAQPNVDVDEAPHHVSSEIAEPDNDGNTFQSETATRSTPPPNEREPVVGVQDGLGAAQLSLGLHGQPHPAADLPREAASHKPPGNKAIVRPLLPGGWVSENPQTPSESLLPTRIELIPATTTTDGSWESKIEASDSPVEPAAEPVPVHVHHSQGPSPNRAEPGKESNLTAEDKADLPTSRSASPHILPPLRRLSPAPSTTATMTPVPQHHADERAPEKIAIPDPTTPVPKTATSQNSEITPTAPLNPRRDHQEESSNIQPVLSPPSYGTGSAMEGETSSPLKESDVLSEEIMKSLSPIQSSESLSVIHRDTTAAYQAAAEPAQPVRESSYLGDVYDDYWTATEEKMEPKLVAVVAGKPADMDKALDPSDSNSTKAPRNAPAMLALDTTAVTVTPSVPAIETRSVISPSTADRRRFSWEAGFRDPASVDIQPVEQNALISGGNAGKLGSPTVTSPPASPSAERHSPGPESMAESSALVLSAPVAGLRSHQVSQASSLVPPSTTGTPAEPPSPVSLLSEKEVVGSSPPVAEAKNFIDEKIAVEQTTTRENRASPVPSLERQGAPVNVLHTQKLPAPPLQQLRKGSIAVLPFRQVMEMGSPAERVKHFNESRSQFAAMDTGLDEWLSAMLSKHPEHRTGNVLGFGGQQGLQSPAGQPPHLQQQGGPGSQGLQANIPMPPPQQHVSGAFGHLHSSNQVGTKSKELLMAAGKAGKGLFSKGRNKLRGTGDKVFSST
ncbi:hypothetical protein QBC35DRAFT_176062 [Podospora australis]|uniref:Uncharacterized protein n=1 Tax=Podospora australis TaxID=1536484 RepID=A0AAN6WYT3_9PEZI|nr:hypothetical protein QBC35DRAFT_176062 [Podospora australis]